SASGSNGVSLNESCFASELIASSRATWSASIRLGSAILNQPNRSKKSARVTIFKYAVWDSGNSAIGSEISKYFEFFLPSICRRKAPVPASSRTKGLRRNLRLIRQVIGSTSQGEKTKRISRARLSS